jgi:hypothetical protein
MISIEQFYMGRDKQYAADLTSLVKVNAAITVSRANSLLDAFYKAVPTAHQRGLNSGWRPPAVNKTVPNAAFMSKHTTGQAIDIGDDDGQLDAWCMTDVGKRAMTDIGLWLEHPSSTPRWCHLQIVPPHSGNRVFFP